MSKKVLVAPLDWGLGHATRSVVLINELIKQGCEVQIASSGDALILLQREFPDLLFHRLVSYRASYSARLPLMVKIVFQLPKFLMAIRKEHDQIKNIIKLEKIDLVLSDNRYGCWSAQVPSVLITHQINILMNRNWKWLERSINYGNWKQIKKFTECWVPDFPNGITQPMSELKNVKAKFIGMLSRFEKMNPLKKYDLLILLSGPEPQRSIFETIIKEQLADTNFRFFLVRGKPSEASQGTENESNHLSAKELNELIESSSLVISRPGYTTIMDLWRLGKKAIFIPTPGQTEQEYLADELMKRKIAFSQNQSKFNLKTALSESEKYSGFEGFDRNANLLPDSIEEFLKL
ncbi:MAG: glycosyltransferase [Bacteroidetes bacterium]|nr:glycosyltransferase [Bacteroidota bacterium]